MYARQTRPSQTAHLIPDKLSNQLAQLTAKITACRICLAPHKKLPPELLSSIFEYCVSKTVRLPPRLYEGPLLLCQICSYWRRVALGTPTLWNDIAVNFHWVNMTEAFVLLDIAKTWLARSGAFIPLSIAISIYHAGGLEPWTLRDLQINPYIARCRELTISVPFASLEEFLVLLSDRMEFLAFLDLTLIETNFDPSWWRPSPQALTFLGSAHRLRNATFRCPRVMLDGQLLSGLPPTQLTDLHLVGTSWLSPDTCHAILRRSTNLVNCTVAVTSDTDLEQMLADLDPTVLPKLRRFELRTSTRDAKHAFFLRPLVLPALKDFEITGFHGWSRSVTSLCSRSSFELERFTILERDVDGHDLELLLQHMPSLRKLNIRYSNMYNGSTFVMKCKGLPKLKVVNAQGLYRPR